MSTAKSAQQLLKTNYRKLYRELLEQNKRLYEMRAKDQLKKQEAILKYQKINLLKSGKSAIEAEDIIKARKEQLSEQQRQQDQKRKYLNSLGITADLKELLEPAAAENQTSVDGVEGEKLLHKANVVYVVENFLRSQRQYQVLLERYNPGMTMTQEDKVRKTAQKVGLDVPSNY